MIERKASDIIINERQAILKDLDDTIQGVLDRFDRDGETMLRELAAKTQENRTVNEFDIFELPVHPHAALFPMLSEEELTDLAADIKANGLRYPLVVQEIEDGDGDHVLTLIDGRNRMEACRRAGVTPETTLLNGQDATAYILSANINRRHLTKGQRAMAVAMLYPEPEKGGRGKNSSKTEGFKIASGYISEARTVITHAPALADQVIAGSLSLDVAYKDACAAKKIADSYEGNFAELKEKAPDLAKYVLEEGLTIIEAMAALRAREKEERQRKYDKAHALYGLEDAATELLNEQAIEATARFIVEQREIYEDYAKRPVSGLIRALETFHENAGKVLAHIHELTEENTDAR